MRRIVSHRDGSRQESASLRDSGGGWSQLRQVTRWFTRRCRCLRVGRVTGVALACVLLAGRSGAQLSHADHPEQSDSVVPLTFQQALLRGARRGPDAQIAVAQRSSRAAAVEHSNPVATQVPVFQAQLGPRFSDGTTSPELVMSLSQPFALSNMGRAQESLAQAERRLSTQDVRGAAIHGAELAGLVWIELALSEKLLQLRKMAAEQSAANLHLVESRVRAGQVKRSELALAQSDLAATQAQIMDAEGRHFEASSQLAFFTGLAAHQRAETKGELLGVPNDGPAAPSAARANHPVIQSAEAQVEISRAAIDYVKAQQSPSLSVGVQYQREGGGDKILTGIVSLPLPLWKPWKFEEARKRAQYDQDQARLRVMQQTMKRELERAQHERHHALAQYQLLKTAGLPPRQEAVRIAQAQFEAGQRGLLRVSWARRELLATQENLAKSLADWHRADLIWRRCTGALEGATF